LQISTVEARDIPDAWFQCISKILDVGFKYEVQQGSYVGQTRLEFEWITVHIKYPYATPYDLMLPDIPYHLGIPNPVVNGYVEQYLPYLMSEEIQPGEDYTYGSRIVPQIHGAMVNLLRETPGTNQAILQVARPEDHELTDPPCLRHIDMRVKDNTLIFYPYFRSWDLWGGFPANLAGIAVLQKYIADLLEVDLGPMVCSSKGLHIYGYVEELAKLRVQGSAT